jgi:superfamily II DNA or RNA helicase
LFTYVAASLAAKQRRAWILVHRQELLTQTSRALTQWGVEHALISPQYSFQPHAQLQVASVQTLVRRLDKLPAPDLIICDEAHHAVSPAYRTIIDRHGAKLLGVTATPARLDGKGLGDVFSKMVIGPTVADLTRDGFLAPATVYAPPTQIDMQGVGKVAGDYARGETAARVDKPTITGDAVQHYTRICPGVPAIAFCVSVIHAEHVARDFCAAGYRAASVDGSMPDPQRRGLIQGLANGQIQVLTSCDLISEGLDISAVTAAILLRPTYSLALARQQMGRALRPAPDKARAIILDHSGNCLRHGLPTEEIEWTLESGGRRKKSDDGKTIGCRQCATCYAVSPLGSVTCRECGAAFEIKPREIETRDGELVEFAQVHADMAKAAKQREIQTARTREDLERIARQRGYAPGWVNYILAARQKNKARGPIDPYAKISAWKGER